MPAGRLRRADADRADGPRRAAPGPAGRGRDRRRRRRSPASLLFGYVGAFMYEGDSPLAERRAAALSLDTTLLAELLGRVELRELLDPTSSRPPPRSCSTSAEDRAARDAEGVADLLRLLGPLTEAEIADAVHAPSDVGGWLDGLRDGQARADGVVRRPDVVGGGRGHRPAARRRRGRGAGRGARRRSPKPSPTRWASCSAGTPAPTARSPRATPPPGSGWACGSPADVLGRLAVDGKLVRGEFTDTAGPSAATSGATPRCCKILRRRSLAALRAQVEPVSTAALRPVPAGLAAGRRGQRRASTAWPR